MYSNFYFQQGQTALLPHQTLLLCVISVSSTHNEDKHFYFLQLACEQLFYKSLSGWSLVLRGSAGKLNLTSCTGLAYGFSTFKVGGKHASVHGFFFLQLLVQLVLGPL